MGVLPKPGPSAGEAFTLTSPRHTPTRDHRPDHAGLHRWRSRRNRRLRLSLSDNALNVDFALEARCYSPRMARPRLTPHFAFWRLRWRICGPDFRAGRGQPRNACRHRDGLARPRTGSSADDHLTQAVKGVAIAKPKRRMVGRIPIVCSDDFARSGQRDAQGNTGIVGEGTSLNPVST